jgi:phosphate transport system substrate-binding protein
MAASLVLAACGGDDDAPVADSTPEASSADSTPEASSADSTADMSEESTGGMSEDTSGGATFDGTAVTGTLNGAGASSQAAAMQGWQAGFQAYAPGATVNYEAIGSGGGRETFLAGGTDFAGSDAYLSDEEYAASVDRCAGDQGAVNLPHYISPIAVAYNLPSLEGTTLNLSPAVLAGIYANTITAWNDPAIAADNPGVDLPDLAVNPVHRSDESGTTKNFTDYLSQVAGDVWTFGAIEAWDADGPGGGEGADGTSGVVAATAAGEGSIGYADASQIGSLPAAAIGVGDAFVEFSPEAAAKIVDVSERVAGRTEFDFAFDLTRDTTESGVYPIALVSYHIVCLQYETQEKVDLIKSFMTWVGSEEGQAASQASAGSAPISPEIRAQLLEVIDTISVAG